MRNVFPLLLVLLLLPGFASAAEYWVVIPDDGTVQDVLNGANFAASMKGSVGVTFQSKDPTTLESGENLDDIFVVLFDDTDVTVIPGTLSEFDKVRDNAEVYLKREGFNVEVEYATTEDLAEMIRDGEEPMPNSEPQDLPEQDDEVLVDGEISDPLPTQIDIPTLETGLVDVGDDQSGDDDAPNVFVVIWRWFVGIFS